MKTGQTPSADEDSVIQSKAPGQLLNGSCAEIVLSAFVSKKKNELSVSSCCFLLLQSLYINYQQFVSDCFNNLIKIKSL